MEIQEKNLQKEEKAVRYTHINSGAPSVCIMFSGAGYNYNHPLFYYATMMMIEQGIDVVHIHYQYEANLLKTHRVEDISSLMMADIHLVITDLSQKHIYQKTILLGKSLGTIPITLHLAKEEFFREAQIILLTPLLKFPSIAKATVLIKQEVLLVMGNQDPYFHHETIEKMKERSIQIEIIDGANHSLDIDYHTEHSLQTLKTVMAELKRFIS
ncbi:alpha/beta hydrolase [Cytobacillus kochii]|uniref:alpha/beta family hydrolase n=1 Tax=Cytobacillus kochii TaxID=859143 RepID=UPI003850ABB2